MRIAGGIVVFINDEFHRAGFVFSLADGAAELVDVGSIGDDSVTANALTDDGFGDLLLWGEMF